MCACVCVQVCELNIMDGWRTEGGVDRQIRVSESVCFWLCTLSVNVPATKIASSVFSEWKFRMSFNLCGLNYSVSPAPVAEGAHFHSFCRGLSAVLRQSHSYSHSHVFQMYYHLYLDSMIKQASMQKHSC